MRAAIESRRLRCQPTPEPCAAFPQEKPHPSRGKTTLYSARLNKAILRALGAGVLLAALLPAQIVGTLAVAAPSATRNPNWAELAATAKLGIALPSAPHTLVLWNFAGAGFDRLARQNGGALETGLEAWISLARRPALSFGPLLILEAAVGRRFGEGLHGYTAVGIGAGWSWGSWVPFVEYRRRAGFHATSPVDHQIVVGVHYILFG